MSVMNTFSGKKFDPMHMNSEDVSLEDLAHALSLLCRGGGHLFRRTAFDKLHERSKGKRMVEEDTACMSSA